MATTETIHDLLNDLKDFEATPEGFGFELRLDLADIVYRVLKDRGMTQAQLAQAAGLKPAYLTRVLHSATNCTFSTAGKILHALDIRARLVVDTGSHSLIAGICKPAYSQTWSINDNEEKEKITIDPKFASPRFSISTGSASGRNTEPARAL